MGLLPLREGDDGPISSMPSSSELCTGLYCTMAAPAAPQVSATEGYGCPESVAAGVRW